MVTGTPRTGVIVAARLGSSRLPGKALKPLAGMPSLVHLLRRLKPSRLADVIVLATTTRAEDDALAELAATEGIAVFRGPQDDVVRRYVAAAEAHGIERVVRVTGDCPFVDGDSLDHCLAQCAGLEPFDLASTKGVFPIGIDFEVYPAARMVELDRSGVLTPHDREHLTLHLYEHADRFTVRRFERPADWPMPHRALTLDTDDDLAFLSKVADAAGSPGASVRDILHATTAVETEVP